MKQNELKDFLDEKVTVYNHPSFIESDPIQIPHLFTKKEDIEISAFLVATIAWGNRKSIINNGKRLVEIMGNSPYDFVMDFSEENFSNVEPFVHRTFNHIDLAYFFKSLNNIYINHGGLEYVFSKYAEKNSLQPAIHHFKKVFFSLPHLPRTQKHISDPLKNSAAKRINMFLRWMVRNDNAGVDFGIWESLSPSQLSCPLDVHSGNVARQLNLLKRKQNDSKALEELDDALRKLDKHDPVKYDFALFGLGAFEKFTENKKN
ncbi:TIGR02757 family protein [Aequorivita echinoideorum]|uniref:TIGR02757 family protein n=1 Tax=Aequorivita echinoideorum TaxID=1549647 RepID=A0ABS5S6W9_9FLAO|nr:TIGR02757 family protein [Aequorivita echinoideorum]MBT0608934.1 TIGR02757 family protein [Aequorivita echinoideorum]